MTFTGAQTSSSQSFIRQADGKVLASYDNFSGQMHSYGVQRLNLDGSADASFSVVTNGEPSLMTTQPDGRVLLGGDFTKINGQTHQGLARLGADGVLEDAFNASVQSENLNLLIVLALTLQDDDKILVGGLFTGVNGVAHQSVARLFADGTLDPNFTVDATDNGVNALAIQSDHKLLLGGVFNTVNGTPRLELARVSGGQRPALLTESVPLANGVYYLKFAKSGSPFGYYTYLPDSHYVYHFDMGYEYVFDAADIARGAYLYDFASSGFFYTSAVLPFPYLYDFSLQTFLYYYPNPNDPDHYNINGVHYFYRFDTDVIISK